jgi:predicted site-specific integrase-resolvase
MQDVKLRSSTEACLRLGISRSTLTQWLGKQWIVAAEQLGNGAYVFTDAEIERAAREQNRELAS